MHHNHIVGLERSAFLSQEQLMNSTNKRDTVDQKTGSLTTALLITHSNGTTSTAAAIPAGTIRNQTYLFRHPPSLLTTVPTPFPPPIIHQPPPLSLLSKVSAIESARIISTPETFELEEVPCSISSILPIGMSCRGRAEAFARSLQSRLRTLGNQGNEGELTKEDRTATPEKSQKDTANDETWNEKNVDECEKMSSEQQPLRLQLQATDSLPSTETADSYFDFDMEPESPGSPIDECEYTRLIETSGSTPQENTTGPESGFVCASPCSTQTEGGSGHNSAGSSSEMQFYDPQSSSDFNTTTTDPNRSVSMEFYDCTSAATVPSTQRKSTLYHRKVGVFNVKPPMNAITTSPSSSCSSYGGTTMNGHINNPIEIGIGDSSDSLPPSQSTTEFTNSSSKSSNCTMQDDVELTADEDNIDTEKSFDNDDEKLPTKLSDLCKTKFIKYNDTDELDDEETSVIKEIDTEAVESKITPEINTQTNKSNDFCQEKILAELISDVTPNIDIPVIQVPDENDTTTKDGHRSSDEEEYERPPRVRRCSSLKTGKTPPGTPGRKKIVRFADVLGLDLADVRTFLDEVPKIPKSAYEDLDMSVAPARQALLGPPLEKVLVTLFQQPGAMPGFLEKVRDKQVCLESAAVTDPVSLTITGCVRVRNLDFHKSVHVRYTLDNWRSYSDLMATYVENSCDGFSDKFSFILFGNSMQIGQRMEMAIRFQAKGEQFWDNNYGSNYCFQCLPCNTNRENSNPLIIASDSSSSEPSEREQRTPGKKDSNGVEIRELTDCIGHRQWSNTYLY